MSAGAPRRYRIHAWGSGEYPDINMEAESIPTDINWKYPFVNVEALFVITREEFEAAFRQVLGVK